MAPRVNRGEIWLYTFSAPDKRRPVFVGSVGPAKMHAVCQALWIATGCNEPVP